MSYPPQPGPQGQGQSHGQEYAQPYQPYPVQAQPPMPVPPPGGYAQPIAPVPVGPRSATVKGGRVTGGRVVFHTLMTICTGGLWLLVAWVGFLRRSRKKITYRY